MKRNFDKIFLWCKYLKKKYIYIYLYKTQNYKNVTQN